MQTWVAKYCMWKSVMKTQTLSDCFIVKVIVHETTACVFRLQRKHVQLTDTGFWIKLKTWSNAADLNDTVCFQISTVVLTVARIFFLNSNNITEINGFGLHMNCCVEPSAFHSCGHAANAFLALLHWVIFKYCFNHLVWGCVTFWCPLVAGDMPWRIPEIRRNVDNILV